MAGLCVCTVYHAWTITSSANLVSTKTKQLVTLPIYLLWKWWQLTNITCTSPQLHGFHQLDVHYMPGWFYSYHICLCVYHSLYCACVTASSYWPCPQATRFSTHCCGNRRLPDQSYPLCTCSLEISVNDASKHAHKRDQQYAVVLASPCTLVLVHERKSGAQR